RRRRRSSSWRAGHRAVAELEVYDFPGEHTTFDEARHDAITRLRGEESSYETAVANADTRGIGVGHHFKVWNLPRLVHNDKSYLVVKASYTLQTNSYEGDGAP